MVLILNGLWIGIRHEDGKVSRIGRLVYGLGNGEIKKKNPRKRRSLISRSMGENEDGGNDRRGIT